jgi:hypothetical protein
MVQTAALLKPSQKKLDAIKDYTVKIDSETISDLPLKATLIFEALQKYNISPATLADVLGKSPETVNDYLSQRIDPNLLMDFYGVPYREIDRAKVERQIKAQKQILGITYSGGMSDEWYTHDMAQKLAIKGISDLQEFKAHQNDLVLPIGTAVRAGSYSDESETTYKYVYVYDDEKQYEIDSSKVAIKLSIDPEGNSVREYVLTEPITLDLGVDYFYNKTNGKKFSQSAGNVWESAYEGKGGVYYKVKFTNTGLPVFYTQYFETGWKAEIAPFLPFIAIIGVAVGLPLLVGESILGAVGVTVESAAISATIGNVAINTVLTGGDIGAALAKSAAGAAGGYVGDFAGTGLDSVEIGKIAESAATAAIQGKDPKNAAALTALTLGVSMGDDYLFVDDEKFIFDDTDTVTFDDIGVDLDAFDLDSIIAENEFNLESIDLSIDSELPDELGNIFNGVGEVVELGLAEYWDGVGINAETADVVDPYNRILIPGDQAVRMTEAEIQAELDRAYRESQGQTVAAGRTYATRKADLPPPAANVKVPTLLDQSTYADKLLKAAVGIGASIKAIANGTFRPSYSMSPYGTARVQAVGVPITQPDGSVIVNNGNGTQTIRYPNGQTKTVGTTYSSSGMFGGISSTTLLIGGGVLLAALLLARRK